MEAKVEVLFVCVANAGRSRMAEAFYNQLSGRKGAASAGTVPAAAPHPEVVETMSEEGIDLSGPGRLLTEEMLSTAEKVITMGCSVEDACPGVLVEAEDWSLADPAGKSAEEVRRVRDEIRARVKSLLSV